MATMTTENGSIHKIHVKAIESNRGMRNTHRFVKPSPTPFKHSRQKENKIFNVLYYKSDQFKWHENTQVLLLTTALLFCISVFYPSEINRLVKVRKKCRKKWNISKYRERDRVLGCQTTPI